MARKNRRGKITRARLRGALLAVLSQEKPDRKTGEPRPVTQAEAARALGISVRTLRRWKNEGVTPAGRSRRAVERLIKSSSKITRAESSKLAADRRKHKTALKLNRAKLPAVPKMHRRALKRYRFDKAKGKTVATGETYSSNWANYEVRGWNFSEISALLVQVWQAGNPFQFIYEVPSGGQLPKSGGKPARKVRSRTRASTAPINPGAFESEEELLDFLHQYIEFEATPKGRRLLYIAVDDNKLRGRQ